MKDTLCCNKSRDDDQPGPIVGTEQNLDCRKQGLEKDVDDFDPYEYGNENGIGRWAAAVHIVRSTIGIGILLMPYIMKNLGYFNGTLLVVCISFTYYHTVHVLISVEYHLCRMLRIRNLTFVGVTDQAFGRAPFPLNKLQVPVRCLIYAYYSFPVSLITFQIVIATNVQQLGKYFDLNLSAFQITSVLIVPLTICCMHRRILQILVPFSSITNIFTAAMAGIIAGCSIIYRNANVAPRPFCDFALIPQGLATYLLAIRGTGIIIPLKNDMLHPRQLSAPAGSLNVASITITSIYYTFGLIMYLNYGDEIHVNALSNLPSKNMISFIVYLLFTLTLCVTYVLAFYARFQTVWSGKLEQKLEKSKYKCLLEYLIRICMNVVAYLMAIGCPHLSVIAAISGTAGIIVEIVLPPVLELLLMCITKKNCCLTIVKNAFIIGISTMVFCMSTIRCVDEVKRKILK